MVLVGDFRGMGCCKMERGYFGGEIYSNMQKVILVLSFSFILISCGQHDKSYDNTQKADSLVLKTIQNNSKANEISFESLLKKYISQSKNELIAHSRKNEMWLFDRTENADTAIYLVYQIGHDETDKGNTNPRFVTDQWIYIDSLNSKLYEYDLLNDSLIEWKN